MIRENSHRWRSVTSVVLAVMLSWGVITTVRYVADLHLKPSQQTIILVHGLLNKPFMMNGIARVLREAGYPVYNWGYPSTVHTIEEHAASLNSYVKGINKN